MRNEQIYNQERIKEQVSHTLFMLSKKTGMPVASKKLGGEYNFTLEELADEMMSHGHALQLAYDKDFKNIKDGVNIDTLTAERDELREIVGKCRDHLDGCSHGYSDELWDSVNEAAERARGEG